MAIKNVILTDKAIQALKDGKYGSPRDVKVELAPGMKFVITGLDYVTYERKDDEPIEYFALTTTQTNISLSKFMGPIGSDRFEYWQDLFAEITEEAFKEKYNVKYRSPKAFAEKELPTLVGKTIEVLCVVTEILQTVNRDPYEAVRVVWKVSK